MTFKVTDQIETVRTVSAKGRMAQYWGNVPDALEVVPRDGRKREQMHF